MSDQIQKDKEQFEKGALPKEYPFWQILFLAHVAQQLARIADTLDGPKKELEPEECDSKPSGWTVKYPCIKPKGHDGNHEDSFGCWWT